jgi:hypothetical protein
VLTREQQLDAFERFLRFGARENDEVNYLTTDLYRLAGLFRRCAAWGASVEARFLVEAVQARFAARSRAAIKAQAPRRREARARKRQLTLGF